MKKFINPEMNLVHFDVENIVTGSTAEYMAEESIKENGVKINGVTYNRPQTITLTF